MKFRQFIGIVEMPTKVISMGVFLMTTIYVYWAEGLFLPGRFLLMLAAVLAVDMGTTAFNTYFDFLQGIDSHEYNKEKNKVLVHDGVSASAAFWTAVILFAIAGVFGVVIAFIAGWPVIIAGGLCMAVGFLYTGGPYPISRTPLGEPVAGGFMGMGIPLITWYVYAGAIPPRFILVTLPLLVIIGLILLVNNTCDIIGDTAAGRKTFSILVGQRGSRIAIIIYLAAVYILSMLCVYQELLPAVFTAFCALSLLFSIAVYRSMFRDGFSHATKMSSMQGVAKIFTVYIIMIILSLATDIIIR